MTNSLKFIEKNNVLDSEVKKIQCNFMKFSSCGRLQKINDVFLFSVFVLHFYKTCLCYIFIYLVLKQYA